MTELRPVQPQDYTALSQFLRDFRVSREPAFWLRRMRHWWEDNPAFSPALERGWLLEDNRRIVGFLGVIPRLIETPAGLGVSSNTTTSWVLPEYRRHSL